jgi:predicted nucleic acid-binding Zn ribbon protein
MPTYVYKFVDTGETIEIQQAFTDDALTEAVHPSSGATMAVKKVFQPVGVTFKGGGFYKTDSRGSGNSTSTTGAPASTAAAGTPSTSTTDGGGSTTSTTSSTPSTPTAPSTPSTPSAATPSSSGSG